MVFCEFFDGVVGEGEVGVGVGEGEGVVLGVVFDGEVVYDGVLVVEGGLGGGVVVV